MTNPTTYFGWQMPTTTDLVTDLPADFEVFGQAVDTDFQDLLGGTTGQILSKTSATDLDFTWITNDVGDITAVTAGTGITGGGTSGAVTITNDMATTITAAGDIVVGTGSGTYDNLPIGTTAQVLTADTSVSPYKVKWATPASGGMTLLESGSFSGASVTTGTLSGAYNDLEIHIFDQLPATGNTASIMRFNGDANTRYRNVNAAQAAAANIASATSIEMCSDTSNADGSISIKIPQYATTGFYKIAQIFYIAGYSATQIVGAVQMGAYNQTGAITTITFAPATGNWSGGTYKVYGVK